jgi:hypothetical protein
MIVLATNVEFCRGEKIKRMAIPTLSIPQYEPPLSIDPQIHSVHIGAGRTSSGAFTIITTDSPGLSINSNSRGAGRTSSGAFTVKKAALPGSGVSDFISFDSEK